jgi:uncharacterized membrane protein
MIINWAHAAPTILAAFLACLVECVEALTVILAVGAVRGWRGALGGAGLALFALVLLVVVLGPSMARVPQDLVRICLGTLLLLFGLRWLRKAIMRTAGLIALHDEDAAYARQKAAMQAAGGLFSGLDRVAVSTAFKITMVEGIEVVFIVIAVGASGHGLLQAAALGAFAALLLVAALGFVLHRPISMVPENMLKFIVGVLLCAFGTFWVGEGMGFAWPGGDLALLELNAGFMGIALLSVQLCRARAARRVPASL